MDRGGVVLLAISRDGDRAVCCVSYIIFAHLWSQSVATYLGHYSRRWNYPGFLCQSSPWIFSINYPPDIRSHHVFDVYRKRPIGNKSDINDARKKYFVNY